MTKLGTQGRLARANPLSSALAGGPAWHGAKNQQRGCCACFCIKSRESWRPVHEPNAIESLRPACALGILSCARLPGPPASSCLGSLLSQRLVALDGFLLLGVLVAQAAAREDDEQQRRHSKTDRSGEQTVGHDGNGKEPLGEECIIGSVQKNDDDKTALGVVEDPRIDDGRSH